MLNYMANKIIMVMLVFYKHAAPLKLKNDCVLFSLSRKAEPFNHFYFSIKDYYYKTIISFSMLSLPVNRI